MRAGNDRIYVTSPNQVWLSLASYLISSSSAEQIPIYTWKDWPELAYKHIKWYWQTSKVPQMCFHFPPPHSVEALLRQFPLGIYWCKWCKKLSKLGHKNSEKCVNKPTTKRPDLIVKRQSFLDARQWQCDQMSRLFVQFLAIWSN